jgi:acyl transferase domain-containing protein/NADPH:quinone reductase-like Zn-dependent oxidoreductase/SAM-dependent methyltransferase/acyl carrier protein
MNTRDPATAAPQAQLSPLKRAMIALEAAEARIRTLEQAAHAPVAIIGIGCRVPGADGPDAFWRLLDGGVDATGPVPEGRWDHDRLYEPDPERTGRISTRRGGFIDRIDAFDATLFGISLREARSMDPQQRLFLQTAWEALEHAGIAPDTLSGSSTGVFCGVTSSDYTYLQVAARDPALLDAHFTSGIAHSVLSGRLSYLLGLQGPSITIDTACSSSLVAVHQAIQSLRRGETRLAIAGGVNLMLSPEIFIALSRAHMLSPDGRCKAFDASADGFARAEGCGTVVLKSLADAQADGDRVLAVLRGSAVNQDGPSSGLTAPSGPAQEGVIRAALADAGVATGDLGYLEAHGTGTNLGDPQEMRALGNVFAGRQTPLVVGSVKTNLGHLEGAAGVTGLIKLVLMLRARQIPRHLHFKDPSPHIPWSDLPLRVPAEPEQWVPIKDRRIASVSSFGFSGTNAHVVVEEAPPHHVGAPDSEPAIVTLSAASEESLRQLASLHAERLSRPDAPELADLCRTANAGRAQLAFRAIVTGANVKALREPLQALASGGGTVAGPIRKTPQIAFLFTGQGAQFAGMGRDLYARVPVFRDTLDRAAARLDARLLDVMFGANGTEGLLDQTRFTQPALFAFEYAMAQVWADFGVQPDLVIGHSVGEFAAACVAGVLDFDSALDLVAERGRLMDALPEGGGMLSVAAPEETVRALLKGELDIAAVNAPDQTVVSGRSDALNRMSSDLAAEGIQCRRLPVSHAFHSSLVDPALDAFETVAKDVSFGRPNLRLISNLTGKSADAAAIGTPGYWRRHMREPVRFADGAAELARLGATAFVEIGPQPVLTALTRETLDSEGLTEGTTFAASMRRGRSEWGQLQDALGAVWMAGVAVDWQSLERLRGGRVVDIPTYPFCSDRHWISPRPDLPEAAGATKGLLGSPVPVALEGTRIWEGAASVDAPDWAPDHVVNGQTILPGAALMAMMAATRTAVRESVDSRIALEDILFEAPVTLPEAGSALALQTVACSSGITVYSRVNERGDWLRHASAKPADPGTLAALPKVDRGERGNPSELYDDLQAQGIALGPAFRVIEMLDVTKDSVVGTIALPDAAESDPELPIHPLLLDGCLQLIGVAPAIRATGVGAFLPFAADRLALDGTPERRLRAHVSVRNAGADILVADIHAETADGRPVLALTGLRLRPLAARPALKAGGAPLSDALYTLNWVPHAGLPSPEKLVAKAATQSSDLAKSAALDRYDVFADAMDAACIPLLHNMFAGLGWQPAPGTTVAETALARQLGIIDEHRRLFSRMLEILAEAGDLQREGADWRVVRALGPKEAETDLRRVAPPAALPEVEMLMRAGAGLGDALRGKADPLELLFPGGDTRTAEDLYGAVPTSIYFNGLIAEVLSDLADVGRPLRVLEIGGGTGGTTARVIERLPADTEYVFSDIGPSFVERARERFGDRRGMRFQLIDLERDLVDQGLEPGVFDVVICANVVHATRDLGASLARIKRVMATDARLVMLEVTSPRRWFDLTVGLTSGWWAYSDTDLRSDGPLLNRQSWLDLLRASGFSAPAALDGNPEQPGSRGRQAVFVAGAGDAHRDRCLILPDADLLASNLCGALIAAGVEAEVLSPDEDLGAALSRMAREGKAPGRVVALGGGLRRTASDRTMAVLEAIQALAKFAPDTKLTLITRGAERVEGQSDTPRAEEAAVAGLARSVGLELPNLECQRIDIEPGTEDPAPLVAALLETPDMPEIALRGSSRLVARVAPWTTPDTRVEARSAWRLVNKIPGTLEHLDRAELTRREPGPGEVEIAVDVAGLNFRDVLNALGEYPGAPPLGGECAGRIVATGADVQGLSVGDAVVGMSPGALASHLTLPAALTARLPESFDMIDGAAFAIPFVTADYCLREVGGIRPGERVLIHAAAGGVGMAALQIALAAGAEVYATAGSEEKRALVRGLGVAHVMDSRSPDFLAEVREATGGEGVDLVLNSLAGEMADASLRSLRPGGRMIELGVRDLRDPATVEGVAPDVRYLPVNWGDVADADPERIGAILRRVLRELDTGRLTPLPRQSFAVDNVEAAFRLMSRGEHVGKIVLTMTPQPVRVRRSGTYLVTGGLSGLGLDTVERLAEDGAGRIVATGRRAPTPETQAVLDGLRARGARIDTHVVDVADPAGMESLISRIRREGPPIRGVVHAAGTLSDAGILSQDRTTIETVMAAKVLGTSLLECLTRSDPLDVFCAFSSLASILGAPGQANHAAANAAMGALLRRRADAGLPGLAIAWGPWSGIGAAADPATIERLAEQGVTALSPSEGRAACAYLMREARGEVAVGPIDWGRLTEWRGGVPNPAFPSPAQPHSIEDRSAPNKAIIKAGHDENGILQQLAEAPPERKRKVLDGFLENTIRASFALPEGRKLDPRTPFGELGLDSLLAIELRNRIGKALGQRLPATLLFENPSLAELGTALMTELGLDEAPQMRPDKVTVTDVFEGLEDLSEAELEQLLGLDGNLDDEAEA